MVESVKLKPIADVDIQHSWFPSELPNAFLAIGEDSTDGEGTYLISSRDKTSIFEFSGIIPEKYNVIRSAKIDFDFCNRPYVDGGLYSESYIRVELYINQEKISVYNIDSDYIKSEGTDFYLSENDISLINSYLLQNKKLPSIWLSISFYIDYYNTSEGKGGGDPDLTTMCVMLDVVKSHNIFDKKGGFYKAATVAYKKQGGMWSEISEEEAKTILNNNNIRRG